MGVGKQERNRELNRTCGTAVLPCMWTKEDYTTLLYQRERHLMIYSNGLNYETPVSSLMLWMQWEKPLIVGRKFVLLLFRNRSLCFLVMLSDAGMQPMEVQASVWWWQQAGAGRHGCTQQLAQGGCWDTHNFQQNKNQEARKKNSVEITSESSGIWSKVKTHLPFSLQFSSKTILYLSSHLCNDVQLQG